MLKVLALVVAMLLAADVAHARALIFPEGSALAVGVWVLMWRDWHTPRWHLVVVPVLCAVTGIAIERSALAFVPAALIVLTVEMGILVGARSRLAPALSAGLLPVVFGVSSWLYPVAVFAVGVVIAAFAPRATGDSARRHGSFPLGELLPFWCVAAGWLALVGAVLPVTHAAAAPPLIVSTLEWFLGGANSRRRAARRWLLIVGAALMGATMAWAISTDWPGGLVAVAVVMVVARAAGDLHPPLLAIALVPQVGGPHAPLAFTGAIALGAAALYALAAIVRRWRPTPRARDPAPRSRPRAS
jgi:hypothetical protein